MSTTAKYDRPRTSHRFQPTLNGSLGSILLEDKNLVSTLSLRRAGWSQSVNAVTGTYGEGAIDSDASTPLSYACAQSSGNFDDENTNEHASNAAQAINYVQDNGPAYILSATMNASFVVTSYGTPPLASDHASVASVSGLIAYEVYDPTTGNSVYEPTNAYCTFWIKYNPNDSGSTPYLYLKSDVLEVTLHAWGLTVNYKDAAGNPNIELREYHDRDEILYSIGFPTQIWGADTVTYEANLTQQYGTHGPDAAYSDFTFEYSLEVTD